jgi:hypothetical protein
MGCHAAYRAVEACSSKDLRINYLGTYWPWTGKNVGGNRAVGWPLYTEAAPTHYSPLGKRHLLEMWAEEGILLWQCPGFVRHKWELFGSALLEPMYVMKASINTVLALEKWPGHSEVPLQDQGQKWTQKWVFAGDWHSCPTLVNISTNSLSYWNSTRMEWKCCLLFAVTSEHE